MKVTIMPFNGGFVDRALVVNLTDRPFVYDGFLRDKNIHLLFVLDDVYIGVDLENYKFYAYLKQTGDWYGPYSTYQELITTLLFGKYDGLFTLLSGIKFDEEKGLFRFKFDDFTYDILTNSFTMPIREVAKLISQTVKKIQKPFVFMFKPETVYKEGVIDSFLVSLNSIFNPNNFPEKTIETEYTLLSVVDRKKAKGFSTPETFFVAVNTQERHLVVFLPYWIYEGYVSYSCAEGLDDFLKELFDENTIRVISNEDEALLAKKLFGVDVKIKESKLFKVNIYKYIKAVIPVDDKGNVAYILRKDDKWYILNFNGVRKEYYLKEFQEFESFGVKVSIINNRLNIGEHCGDGLEFDIALNVKKCIYIDLKTGLCENNKIIFDVRFLENIKGVL